MNNLDINKIYEINDENIEMLIELFIEKDLKYIPVELYIKFYSDYTGETEYEETLYIYIEDVFAHLEYDIPLKGDLEFLTEKIYDIIDMIGEDLAENWRYTCLIDYEETLIDFLGEKFYNEMISEMEDEKIDDSIIEMEAKKKAINEIEYSEEELKYELKLDKKDIYNILIEAIEKNILNEK